MVPILPSGAVELTLFREPTQAAPEAMWHGVTMSDEGWRSVVSRTLQVQLPDEDTLKALHFRSCKKCSFLRLALLNL